MKNFCDKCGNCSRCGECCAATLPITKSEEKEMAHKKAYWNSLKNGKIANLTDMRLLFYNDPRSLIGNLMYGLTNGTMKATEKEFNQLKMVLESGGQVELANCLKGEFK